MASNSFWNQTLFFISKMIKVLISIWKRLLRINSYFDSVSIGFLTSGLIGFLWGFCESVGLIGYLPDIGFSFIAVFSYRKSLWAVFFGVLGAALGASFIFFYLTYKDLDNGALLSLLHPFGKGILQSIHLILSNQSLMLIDKQFNEYGINAFVLGPKANLAFRMYVYRAYDLGYSFLDVLRITPYARLSRFLRYPSIVFLLRLAFNFISKKIKNVPWRLILIFILINKWFLGYREFFRNYYLNYNVSLDFISILSPFFWKK